MKVLIANYHAPKEGDVESAIKVLEKFGVKNIVRQTDVFDAEFFFKLMSIAPIGELSRMTQYKSAPKDDKTAHLMTYPVLMVHDVADYTEVMVGDDQQQHLQFARSLLKRYNREFGTNYRIPKANVIGGRIKDLNDSSKKMSKSLPKGCLFLDDSPDTIRLKLRKAVADEEGYRNLCELHRQFVGTEIPKSNLALKMELAEAIIKEFHQ